MEQWVEYWRAEMATAEEQQSRETLRETYNIREERIANFRRWIKQAEEMT